MCCGYGSSGSGASCTAIALLKTGCAISAPASVLLPQHCFRFGAGVCHELLRSDGHARTGFCIHRTPFFSALLGWLGVFLTGSDTSSNALFGSLQQVTANNGKDDQPAKHFRRGDRRWPKQRRRTKAVPLYPEAQRVPGSRRRPSCACLCLRPLAANRIHWPVRGRERAPVNLMTGPLLPDCRTNRTRQFRFLFVTL